MTNVKSFIAFLRSKFQHKALNAVPFVSHSYDRRSTALAAAEIIVHRYRSTEYTLRIGYRIYPSDIYKAAVLYLIITEPVAVSTELSVLGRKLYFQKNESAAHTLSVSRHERYIDYLALLYSVKSRTEISDIFLVGIVVVVCMSVREPEMLMAVQRLYIGKLLL